MEEGKLVKVVVDLPNHWAATGESKCAKPLGDNLYELRNSPFYAYGLNYEDVVYAVSPTEGKKPLVIRIARRSGNRTLRVRFGSESIKSERLLLLKGLDKFKVSWEGADHKLFSLTIPPDGDYQATCDQLWDWEQAGLLQYETCEAQVEGSFDVEPQSS